MVDLGSMRHLLGDHCCIIFEQLTRMATEGCLQAKEGCQQDIDLPRFDLLDRPRVQVGRLGQLFLGQALGSPKPPQAMPELDQINVHTAISASARGL